MTKSRIISAYLFVILAFFILLIRYGYLQLFNHGSLLQKSINNYSATVTTLPVRGNIIDRNGVILANNKVSYVVAILARDFKKRNNVKKRNIFEEISPYINLTEFDKKKFNTQLRNSKSYDWVIIKDDLSNIEIAKLTAHNYLFPEVAVFAHTKRYYPFNELYASSLGYVGRMSSIDRDRVAKLGMASLYISTDYIGKNGLEQYYELILRGQVGKKTIQTDALGNEVGLIANNSAIDGNSIQLTIDNSLQKLAWELLGNNKGAIVAINPKTGGILAFISKPSFNPNWFIDGIGINDWDELTNDPDKPLLNRASQSSYPPGSIFKPFLGLAALYLGVRDINSTFVDRGYFSIPNTKHKFRDSARHARGLINFSQAITYSSDTFFYKLGLDMGIDSMNQGLSLFGLGQKTQIDLPHENSGLLPSREWKAKKFSKNLYQKKWLPSDSVVMAIGQGFNHYTPLQMAHAVCIIANNGVAISPHFLNKVINSSGEVVSTYEVESRVLPIPKKYFSFMNDAMRQVVEKGTLKSISKDLKYTIAAKTGTAQVVAIDEKRQAKHKGHRFKDHSWVIGFAPANNPKIALAIIVENGGWGAGAAGKIARQMFDAYILDPANLEENNKQNLKIMSQKKINSNNKISITNSIINNSESREYYDKINEINSNILDNTSIDHKNINIKVQEDI